MTIYGVFLTVYLFLSVSSISSAGDALDVWRKRNSTPLNTVRFGAGRFVGVGQGNVATSADGTNWLIQTLASGPNLKGIAFKTNAPNSFFIVAVGDGGNVWSSPDGTNWLKDQRDLQN